MRPFLVRLSLVVTVVSPINIGNSGGVSLAKAPTAKAVLWEVSGKGLDQPSYLLGTRHIGCVKRLALSSEQKQVLGKVEQVYLEIHTKESNQSENTIAAIQSETNVSTGKKLKEQLTPAQYQFIEDYFDKDELDSLLSKNADVFTLYTIVSEQLAATIYSKLCSRRTSKESIVMDAARDRKLPILGVETQQERLGLANSLSNSSNDSSVIVKKLLNTIHTVNVVTSNSVLAEPVFQRIIKEDEQYFYQDIFGAGKEFEGALRKPLIVNRNKLWLPRIQKAMAQKPALFAVGFNHLGGNEGLISLLESQGYTLKPVYDRKINTSQPSDSRAKEYYDAASEDDASGEKLSALNNYDQAIEIWERSNPKNEDLDKAYLYRGYLKRDSLSAFQGALADIDKSISLKPNYAPAYFSRGFLKMEKLRNYQGALVDFNKAVTLNHDSTTTANSYYRRGILKSDHLNDPKGALADFDIYLAGKPQEIDALILRGVLKYTKLSDQSGGISDLRRAALLSRNKNNKEELNRVLAVLKAINVSEEAP
jgi:uncharacterized protein